MRHVEMNKNIIIVAVAFLLMLSACGKGNVSIDNNERKDKSIIISFNSGYVYKENDKYVVLLIPHLNEQEKTIVYNEQRECETDKDILLTGGIDFSRYLNQSFDEVIRDFGTIHTDIGSGRYIPAYFTNDAYLVSFDLDDNTVVAVRIIDLLSGQTTSYDETTSSNTEVLQETSGSVSLDKYYEAYWEEVKRIQSPPSESVIPDENTAKGVAEVIFESLCPDLAEKGYVVQHVRYIETDDVWIATFYPDVKALKSFGGDWNIAIRKKDGSVIRIFVGE